MDTKKVFLISFLMLFAFGFVLAQDENIEAADLEVEEPQLLPDSPFYFFKNLGREIRIFFAFEPIKKAELRERFASEKLIELKKMVEKNKNANAIKNAAKNYQDEIEKMKKATERIKETAEESEQVGKFLDKFVQQQTLHQRILQQLETKVATSTMERIREARERHLERFGEVMTKLEGKNEERIQERLEKNLEKLSTTTSRIISTSTKETIIEIRDRVLEKIRERNQEFCAQVITYRKNPQTGECQMFSTLCSAPKDWEECSGAEPLPED